MTQPFRRVYPHACIRVGGQLGVKPGSAGQGGGDGCPSAREMRNN